VAHLYRFYGRHGGGKPLLYEHVEGGHMRVHQDLQLPGDYVV
jgi:hypothetical protein